MRDIVVGVVGHVDHGKSSLVLSMTGFNGDTSAQEKERGITIDLSFSSIQNETTNVAFIDVPGHDKLIKNMIAGAFGFDAVILAIDALEGIMPQTLEHLEILNLLGDIDVIIAITKSDLCTFGVARKRKDEICDTLTSYKNLNLITAMTTSVHYEKSISNLKKALLSLPESSKKNRELFRCYIDRSFTISGVGNVVTGTVLSGKLELEDKLWLAEKSAQVQVRNIQVHNQDVSSATTSQRVAINLISKKATPQKGHLLTKKGFLRGFKSIDVYIQGILNKKLKHNSKVEFFIGSKQVPARLLLYGSSDEALNSFAIIEFQEPIFAIFDEPFIVTTSGRVSAGGRVLGPILDPIKNRLKIPLLKSLYKKEFKEAFSILAKSHKKGFGLVSSMQRFGLTHKDAIRFASGLHGVYFDKDALVLYPESTVRELTGEIQSTYRNNPQAMLSAKSLSIKIKWASQGLLKSILDEMLAQKQLTLKSGIYKSKTHKTQEAQAPIETKIYDILTKGGITPDAPYNIYQSIDIDSTVGDEALKNLTVAKKVIRLTHNLFVTHENLSLLLHDMRDIIDQDGFIELSNFKSRYPQLSRKYLVAYLEYLDSFKGINKQTNKRFIGSLP